MFEQVAEIILAKFPEFKYLLKGTYVIAIQKDEIHIQADMSSTALYHLSKNMRRAMKVSSSGYIGFTNYKTDIPVAGKSDKFYTLDITLT
jgi:hypothetical protein